MWLIFFFFCFFFCYGFDFGMVGYLVLIVVVSFISGGAGWRCNFFFFGGNFGGDKLGFMAKFWWKVVVGFLEGKRGKIDEKEERETYFFYII